MFSRDQLYPGSLGALYESVFIRACSFVYDIAKLDSFSIRIVAHHSVAKSEMFEELSDIGRVLLLCRCRLNSLL